MARSEFKSLDSLLPRVLAKLAGESGRGRPLAPVWAVVAGPHIARHSTPHLLEGTTLVLTVASAEWAQALAREEASLCERLNERLGAGAVTALSFRLEP